MTGPSRPMLAWILLLALVASPSVADVGDLDPAFGAYGILEFPYGVRDIVAQPDGSLFGAALVNSQLRVYRYDSDGKPDASFASGGVRDTFLPAATRWMWKAGPWRNGYSYWTMLRNDDPATLEIRDSRGELVARQIVMQQEAQLLRIGPDGSPDPGFGDAGILRFPYTRFQNAHISALDQLAVTLDGALYALVRYDFDAYDYVVAVRIHRLKPDGKPDTAFADAGEYLVPVDGYMYWDPPLLTALGSRLLIRWRSGDVTLLDEQGVPQPVPAGFRDEMRGIGPVPYEDMLRGIGARTVVATEQYVYTARTTGPGLRIVVARWHPDLTPDESFGVTIPGRVEIAQPAQLMASLTFQLVPPAADDPHLYLAFNQYLFRFRADGAPDDDFGEAGALRTGLPDMQVLKPQSRGLVSTIRGGAAGAHAIRLATTPVHAPGLITVPLACSLPTIFPDKSGRVSIAIARTLGTDGRVEVRYATRAGTAMPGVDYQETSGLLSWEDGEAGARTIEIGLVRTFATSPRFPDFQLVLQAVEGSPIIPCEATSIAISHQGPETAGGGAGNTGGGSGTGNANGGGSGSSNNSSSREPADHGGGAIDGLLLSLLGLLLLRVARRSGLDRSFGESWARSLLSLVSIHALPAGRRDVAPTLVQQTPGRTA